MNANPSFEAVGRALDEAAQVFGSKKALAKQLTANGHKTSETAIGNWRTRGVPIKAAVKIAALVPKVTRQRLRPDDYHEIWPELATGQENERIAG